MLLTLKVIRNVNLVGAVKYMWALYWIMPIEILFVVSLFDYHRVTDVWVKHWWSTPSMNWFRELFCLAGTAYTKCAMPVGGGSINTTEDEWCELNYNATDCSDIRSEAQQKMTTTSYIFVTGNGIWGVLLILLLFLALTLLEGIITAPIVQSSKETNIPAWLTLPIIGCLAGGSVLLFSPSSALSDGADSGVFWVGLVYMVASGMFFLAALLGWFISAFSVLNNRDKRHKQIAILLFIATMLLTVLSVAAILSTSLIYSASIVRIDYDDKARGNVACYLDTADSCTNCPKSPGHQPEGVWCPEWTDEEVVKVLQTQLKQSATLGAILLIYAFSALRFGFILHSHFSRYQIDYV
uniref:Uncharacterized protein n=1 Tax=Trieres chinensis TaxID=1514140 RepID=A0A7S1YXR5_TRICV|mmetsp:Transcript_12832/g.26613  ORF Transcript_12832/g.26613 Transcript_12832/m.26613 type:complete len:353 (+) Transcript_12832:2-1060(+)